MHVSDAVIQLSGIGIIPIPPFSLLLLSLCRITYSSLYFTTTRSTSKVSITSDLEDETVTPADLGSKTHLVYAVVIEQGQLCTDLTGRFTVISSKGNWYVLICYSYDCIYMKAVTMKSRSAYEWLKSYRSRVDIKRVQTQTPNSGQ
jgi:hypothetical protein